jgi:hypothetical protein
VTDFIWRNHYDALIRRLGVGPALKAIVGDTDEVLVIEPTGGKPKTVHVLERCNDGKIRERPPGMPWPMYPPDKASRSDYIAVIVGAVVVLAMVVYFVGVLVGQWR